MARNVSQAFRTDAFAQQTGEPMVTLLEVTHPEISGMPDFPDNVIRLTDARSQVTHLSKVYKPYGFAASFPPESERGFGASRITIENVDQWLTEVVRSIRGEPRVVLKVVRASTPDVIELEVRAAYLTDAAITEDTIENNMSYEPLYREPLVKHTFSQRFCQGIYK